MRYEQNDCCGCAVPGYPCLGDACSLRHAIYYKCDRCGVDELCEEDMYNESICFDCYYEEHPEDKLDDCE